MKWTTDLAKSTALGYRYKSEPAASGLGAHSWACPPPLQLLPKCLEGFHRHPPAVGQAQTAAVWGSRNKRTTKIQQKLGKSQNSQSKDSRGAGAREVGIAEVGSGLFQCPLKVLLGGLDDREQLN